MMRIEEYYRCTSCGYIRRELYKDGSDCYGSSAYDGAAISSMNADTERSALSRPCPECGGKHFVRISKSDLPEGWEWTPE